MATFCTSGHRSIFSRSIDLSRLKATKQSLVNQQNCGILHYLGFYGNTPIRQLSSGRFLETPLNAGAPLLDGSNSPKSASFAPDHRFYGIRAEGNHSLSPVGTNLRKFDLGYPNSKFSFFNGNAGLHQDAHWVRQSGHSQVESPTVQGRAFSTSLTGGQDIASPEEHVETNNNDQSIPTERQSLFQHLSFEDVRAYADRRTAEIMMSAVVLAACKVTPVVKRLPQLLNIAQRLFGQALTFAMIKGSVYHQFCGGEHLEEVRRTLTYLQNHGIGGIVNYSAENDGSLIPNTLAYELNCQRNFDTIEAISDLLRETIEKQAESGAALPAVAAESYVAVKITSMVDASVLISASQLVVHTDFLWAALVGETPSEEIAKRLGTQGYTGSLSRSGVWSTFGHAKISRSEFLEKAGQLFPDVNSQELNHIFDVVKMSNIHNTEVDDGSDVIDYFQWVSAVTPEKLTREFSPLCSPAKDATGVLPVVGFTESELLSYDEFKGRLESLCIRASETSNVSLLLDGERYNAQDAIDHLSMEMMRRFNQTRTVVYNTYQCYLKDAVGRVQRDFSFAAHNNHLLGLKLVRGAYLQQEREAAKAGGYESPTCDSLEETHNSFDSSMYRSITECKNKKHRVLLGTHNKQSAMKAAKLVESLFGFRDAEPAAKHSIRLDVTNKSVDQTAGINSTPTAATNTLVTDMPYVPVGFAQLLGMCDSMTVSLAKSGFRVYKFTPWGGVTEVMPYLLRRVSENSDMLGSSATEVHLMMNELTRRLPKPKNRRRI